MPFKKQEINKGHGLGIVMKCASSACVTHGGGKKGKVAAAPGDGLKSQNASVWCGREG